MKGAPARGLPRGVRLVHEDEDLIVVEKPPGLLTAGLPGQDIDSVFRLLKAHVRDQYKRRGTKVWIIHRLDKEASGLLVFAKTERAYEFLKEEFRSKRAHRLYAAVVEGELAAGHDTGVPGDGRAGGRRVSQALTGTVQSFLIEDEQGLVHSMPTATGSRGRFDSSKDHAKIAVTHWRVMAAGNGRALLQVRLETGRKNQIRVHMREIKHPIVGDRRYGASTDPIERVCLHASELGFGHPRTGQTVRFSSPTPEAFWSLVGAKAPAESPPTKDFDVPVGPAMAAPAPLRAQPRAETRATREGERTPKQESWDHVAEWYASLIEERRSDHHELVILPGTTRLLGVARGARVLDVACGQGVLSRRLTELGASVVGVDSSPRLIEAARRGGAGSGAPEFAIADARRIGALDIGEFDAAACVMALMNIEPLAPVLEGVASKLREGGRFVAVVLHPAFRAPGQTSWGWQEAEDPKGRAAGPRHGARSAAPARDAMRQYRRVDGYLSNGQSAIIMNPGAVARGQPPVTTMTFHRPIQAYVNAFARAGLLVDAMEEWPSLRLSQPGPRAAEENRARREIPMFLALRGVKAAATKPGATH